MVILPTPRFRQSDDMRWNSSSSQTPVYQFSDWLRGRKGLVPGRDRSIKSKSYRKLRLKLGIIGQEQNVITQRVSIGKQALTFDSLHWQVTPLRNESEENFYCRHSNQASRHWIQRRIQDTQITWLGQGFALLVTQATKTPWQAFARSPKRLFPTCKNVQKQDRGLFLVDHVYDKDQLWRRRWRFRQ